jgi:hypothetical protein
MRIDSAGNVGIGTTSPGSALQVQGLITGTAVTQTATDTTAGRLLKVGDYGAGAAAGTVLFGRANILGTVSQSGGVPTGAVIQRGSNANGEFVRYADGTQICTATVTLEFVAADRFRFIWNFPATFSANPAVSHSLLINTAVGYTTRSNYGVTATAGIGTTQAFLDQYRITGATNIVAGNTVDSKAVAIGRWY